MIPNDVRIIHSILNPLHVAFLQFSLDLNSDDSMTYRSVSFKTCSSAFPLRR